MLLKEIIADVDLIVPNSINDMTKVRWLNQVQRQVYRDYAFPDTSHAFTSEVGKSLYLIPDNCDRDRITGVVVSGKVYEYRSVTQDIADYCYTIVEEKLWIHPVPVKAEDAYLNYRPRPRDMRVDMQDAVPDFPEDFHELLVYGVALRVSRASQDYKLTRELEDTFILLEQEAKRKLRVPKKRHVKIREPWR